MLQKSSVSLFKRIPTALFIADPDLLIQEANAAFCEVFRAQEAELRGTKVTALFSDVSAWSRVTAAEGNACQYVSLKRRDGDRFNAQVLSCLLRDEAGEHIGFGGKVRDLTALGVGQSTVISELEKRAAEFAMLHSDYRRTPAMLHSIDETGALRDVSDKWLERLGYTREEVIGRKSTEFLTQASRDYAKQSVLPEFWAKGYCDRVPYTFVTKTGEPVEVELSAVLDTIGDSTSTLAVLNDVTARNTAMRDLEKRNAHLSTFAHVAAHDLQSPLRHISIFSEMSLEELDAGNTAEARKFLGTVRTASSRLSSLIDSLLAYAQSEDVVAKPEQVSLNVVVAEAISARQTDIEASGARVEVGQMPEIVCDPALLGQALSQIIRNSLTFVAPNVSPKISIAAEQTAEETVLRIADNGIGIEPQFWERIFLPMRRLHGKDGPYAGNGVGLALCTLLVQAMDGHVEVERSDETGTVFRVSLPVQVEPAAKCDPEHVS